MRAEDYFNRIPDGHRRAMQRPSNQYVDRQLRKLIERANNNGDCIINVGNGIYRPIPGDPVDEKEFNEYLNKDRSRASSLIVKGAVMLHTFEGVEARDKRAAEQGKGKIMRNSFVLYTEYAKQISLLTMEQRGQLLTAIIQYVTDDTVPELDAVTEMAFSIIQIRLDRDEEAYQASLERKRRAGAMGGRAKSRKHEA